MRDAQPADAESVRDLPALLDAARALALWVGRTLGQLQEEGAGRRLRQRRRRMAACRSPPLPTRPRHARGRPSRRRGSEAASAAPPPDRPRWGTRPDSPVKAPLPLKSASIPDVRAGVGPDDGDSQPTTTPGGPVRIIRTATAALAATAIASTYLTAPASATFGARRQPWDLQLGPPRLHRRARRRRAIRYGRVVPPSARKRPGAARLRRRSWKRTRGTHLGRARATGDRRQPG